MASLLQRAVFHRAQEILDFSPILVIEGARQVGKSTLAAILTENRRAKLVTLDDAPTLEAARADAASFVEQAGDATLVIDEVQRFAQITLAVKAAVDRRRLPGRFILTGSSDLARIRGDKDSLAGRAMTVRLHPFSQAELRGTLESGTFVDRVLNAGVDYRSVCGDEHTASRDDLIDMVTRGGYPPIVSASARMRAGWLGEYVERLVRVDAREDGGRLDPTRLMTALRLIAANQSGELVKARLASDLSLSPTSTTGYLDALSRLYLIETLPGWSENLTNREVSRHKARVIDSGLASWCAGVDTRKLSDIVQGQKYLGALTEGFVATELSAQRSWSDVDYRIFHYRDSQRHEVDLLIETEGGRLIAIEVKASTQVRSAHFSGLDFFASKAGERLEASIVLAPIESPLSFGERRWALPISSLWG